MHLSPEEYQEEQENANAPEFPSVTHIPQTTYLRDEDYYPDAADKSMPGMNKTFDPYEASTLIYSGDDIVSLGHYFLKQKQSDRFDELKKRFPNGIGPEELEALDRERKEQEEYEGGNRSGPFKSPEDAIAASQRHTRYTPDEVKQRLHQHSDGKWYIHHNSSKISKIATNWTLSGIRIENGMDLQLDDEDEGQLI